MGLRWMVVVVVTIDWKTIYSPIPSENCTSVIARMHARFNFCRWIKETFFSTLRLPHQTVYRTMSFCAALVLNDFILLSISVCENGQDTYARKAPSASPPNTTTKKWHPTHIEHTHTVVPFSKRHVLQGFIDHQSIGGGGGSSSSKVPGLNVPLRSFVCLFVFLPLLFILVRCWCVFNCSLAVCLVKWV